MEIIPRSPTMPQGLQVKPVRLVLGLIAALGIVVTLFSALFGFVSIPTNSVGVKMRFGAYVGTAEPGLAYAIPVRRRDRAGADAALAQARVRLRDAE
jgi:regulator of protease activity HflC (stomatin/prohibitin superfamily)